MAVDYREVNMQLESKKLPYQPTLFQRFGEIGYILRFIICGDIVSYVSLRTVPKSPPS